MHSFIKALGKFVIGLNYLSLRQLTFNEMSLQKLQWVQKSIRLHKYMDFIALDIH